MLRTHTCGELTGKNVGEEVVLYGWARTIRDHKEIIFINLTDRYGWVQVCITREQLEKISKESYVKVKGEVKGRPEKDINKNITTGEIEVECKDLKVISKCEALPFEIQEDIFGKEETRLKYRFLDIRRAVMISRLALRHKFSAALRRNLESLDFMEVETPMMVRSTPEGSRDFVVPSRVFEGKFYALPQSPQLYKQLLMISGVDKYYQFARCFRDEDARRERQLVHTQLDIEISLVKQEDIFKIIEEVFAKSIKEALGIDIPKPFPVYTYDEVINRWGIDKPDLRFGMEIIDFSEHSKNSGFQIFDQTLENDGIVKGIVAPKCANYSRSKIKDLEKFVHTFDAKGIVYLKVKEGKLEGPAAKKIKPEVLENILKHSKANDGDLILTISGKKSMVHRALGELRKKLGKDLDLIDKEQKNFLWVTEFPLFEWSEEEKKWEPMHHMFSMPKEEFIENMEKDPGKVKGLLFDLVLNGVELGSGSIRISSPELQRRIMNLVGISEEEAQKRFGFLLDAYQYASPPHGGIGIGFDNLVMTLLNLDNIRDVIAFPNASNGIFLYDGSPTELETEQLKELHIEIKKEEKKEE